MNEGAPPGDGVRIIGAAEEERQEEVSGRKYQSPKCVRSGLQQRLDSACHGQHIIRILLHTMR